MYLSVNPLVISPLPLCDLIRVCLLALWQLVPARQLYIHVHLTWYKLMVKV